MSALAELEAWVEREKADHGLIELCFTAGSDSSVTVEEAAAVALAMIKYKESQ